MTIKNQKIRFLKKGIRYKGKYIPVHYSLGELYGYPKGTITIYARIYGLKLPPELNPENESDIQTDLFVKDKARITPSNKYYPEVLRARRR